MLLTLTKQWKVTFDQIPSLLTAQALPGCNAARRYYGIAKETVVKQLKKGLQVLPFGDTEIDSTDTLQECSESISSSTTNMTGCQIKTQQVQTGKA